MNEAAKDINAAGGVKVGGQTCTFVSAPQDNKSDPAQVFTAAQQAIDAGSIAAMGPDVNDLVAYNAWKKAGVIDFLTGGQVPVQLQQDPKGTPLAVSLIPFQRLQHVAYFRQALASGKNIKSVALLLPNNVSAQNTLQSDEFAAKALHLKTTVQLFPDGTSDFSTYLSKIAATKPDMLLVGTSSQTADAILKQAVPLNVARYYFSEYNTADSIVADPALASATIFLPTFAPTFQLLAPLPTDNPKVIFPSGKPNFVPGATILGYYGAMLVKQAVEAAGSTDVNKVFPALLKQKYAGPFGTCSVDPKRFLVCQTVFTVVNGKNLTVSVFPTPYSTTPSATYACLNGKCKAQ
jgi:branched-chain amino acid transport system substrate-binding protein